MIGAQYCEQRRKRLLDLIKAKQPDLKSGILLFFSGFEQDQYRFVSNKNAYYLTGVTDPGVVFTLDLDGKLTAYIPNYLVDRSVWCSSKGLDDPFWAGIGCSDVKLLGDKIPGYSLGVPFSLQAVESLVSDLRDLIVAGGTIFSLGTLSKCQDNQHYQFYSSLTHAAPDLMSSFRDVSSVLSVIRQVKDPFELESIQKAIDITIKAQTVASGVIVPGVRECAVRGAIEQVFSAEGALRPSFPSIVGSGSNSVVLHHETGERVMEEGDLVVVDIGAEFDGYAADLTRTFPVSGTFTPRQKQIYDIVLGVQQEVARQATPEMYLRNGMYPERSLDHIARKLFKKEGLERYFPHGLGHHMGLDVHDVTSGRELLTPGSVFTIEPGLYLPEENLGVRIEDDYLMTEDGAKCLSAELVASSDDIEKIIKL